MGPSQEPGLLPGRAFPSPDTRRGGAGHGGARWCTPLPARPPPGPQGELAPRHRSRQRVGDACAAWPADLQKVESLCGGLVPRRPLGPRFLPPAPHTLRRPRPPPLET